MALLNKKTTVLIKAIISIAILLFLFYKIGITTITNTLLTSNLSYLPLILLTLVLIFILHTITLKITLDPIKRIGLWQMFKYYSLSYAIGLFVPGKVGEFSIIYLFKKKGVDIGKGTAVCILDKFITLITLSIIAIIGFILYLPAAIATKLITIIIIMVIASIIIVFSKRSRQLVKKYILRKYTAYFTGFSKTLFLYLKQHKLILTANFILTILKWVVTALSYLYVFQSFNTHVPFLDIFLITGLSVIIALIPISISGLGVRELSAVYFFKLIGISSTITFSTFIFYDILSYIIAAIIIFLLFQEFTTIKQQSK